MLRSRIYEYELEKKRALSRKVEDSKLDIDFGSQIRSYVLQPYRMAKDHRTKLEVGDVDRVLDGDIDPFIRAYLQMRRAEQREEEMGKLPGAGVEEPLLKRPLSARFDEALVMASSLHRAQVRKTSGVPYVAH